jgi:hypothetical protein
MFDKTNCSICLILLMFRGRAPFNILMSMRKRFQIHMFQIFLDLGLDADVSALAAEVGLTIVAS